MSTAGIKKAAYHLSLANVEGSGFDSSQRKQLRSMLIKQVENGFSKKLTKKQIESAIAEGISDCNRFFRNPD